MLMDTGLGDLFEDNASTVRGIHEHVDRLRQGGCRQYVDLSPIAIPHRGLSNMFPSS